jgi:hypothetical protein
MTTDDEKELAEAVLRLRRRAFREAYPEILGLVRRFVAAAEERAEEARRGADRMISDYRAVIAARDKE